jgi:hypothetical protein
MRYGSSMRRGQKKLSNQAGIASSVGSGVQGQGQLQRDDSGFEICGQSAAKCRMGGAPGIYVPLFLREVQDESRRILHGKQLFALVVEREWERGGVILHVVLQQ